MVCINSMPLNYTLKNGFNGQFYVMRILSQHKKVQIYKWDQCGTPQIEINHPLNHFVWQIPMYRLRIPLFLKSLSHPGSDPHSRKELLTTNHGTQIFLIQYSGATPAKKTQDERHLLSLS